ncbi:MAG: ComEC/Rec2 family competence protein, partial [Armatimonadetes bacterium]|nr:ComEC/Rec2 family competence protein [Armatimonadota bacterium]
ILVCGPVTLRPWRPRTNPYQYSLALAWGRRRVWCYAKAAGVRIIRRPKVRSLLDAAAQWRDALTRRLEIAMPGPEPERPARVLAAMVYGAPLYDLPDDIAEAFRRTGTIHVLVVSGAQVTLLVLVLIWLTGRRRRPPRLTQLLFALPATFLYATLCGREPSVMRALALAVILLLGRYGGRPYDTGTALGAAAALLVLAEPADVFAPGLQLTVAACLGVVGAARLFPVSSRLRLPVRIVLLALAGTAGAWAMTVPVLAYHFGGLALAGNIANAVAVPAAEAALLLGMPGALLATIHPMLATVPLGAARLVIDATTAVVAFCARLPGAYLDSVRMNIGLAALWYCAVVAGYVLARYSAGLLRRAAIAGTVAAMALLLVVAAVPVPVRHPTVTWLDVGEGLCTVIELPGRHFIIFDAGSRDPDLVASRMAYNVLVPYLNSRGCRRIDAVIVSHADVDHFNAVPALLQRFAVGRLIVAPWSQGKEYTDLLRQARLRGIPISEARRGAQLTVGAVRVLFVHPQSYRVTESRSIDNDNCLVALLQANRHSVMLTGDVEEAGQRELLLAAGNEVLQAEAVQAPHHGRKSAFWPPFYEATTPRLVVIPCGPAYVGGQPFPELQEYLQARGVHTFRTDQWGATTVSLANEGLRVKTFLNEPRPEPVPELAPH